MNGFDCPYLPAGWERRWITMRAASVARARRVPAMVASVIPARLLPFECGSWNDRDGIDDANNCKHARDREDSGRHAEQKCRAQTQPGLPEENEADREREHEREGTQKRGVQIELHHQNVVRQHQDDDRRQCVTEKETEHRLGG
jgi:hypothetical protein